MRKLSTLTSILLFSIILCQLGLKTQPAMAAIDGVIIDNSRFLTAEKDFYTTGIQSFLEKNSSPLAKYQETVGGNSMSAAQSIWVSSQGEDFGLNPKVLIAILQVEGRFSQTPTSLFTPTLQAMFQNLWDGYSTYEIGTHTYPLANGQTVDAGSNSNTNAASYALARYFAMALSSEKEVNSRLEEFRKAYTNLFQTDPHNEYYTVQADALQTLPFLQLPFAQPAGAFVKVNSFFDHATPGNYLDDNTLRFDGLSLSNASFSTCVVGVNCYSGHNGVDYKTGAGMPILAAAGGTVVFKYFNTDSSQGTVDSGVMIDHGNGYRTAYWHMDPIQVNEGDIVSQGQQIGLSGNIGKSSGPHLHFGLRLVSGNKPVDPYGWWNTSVSDPWGDSNWMWASDMIADDREPQSQFFYTSYWTYDAAGYNNSSFYTLSVTDSSKSHNWGYWGTYIPTSAEYDVYAYWPANSANATSVNYTIFHGGTSSTVTVDQSTSGGQFVYLGTYSFDQGAATVSLNDLSTTAGKRIYFDAVKWSLHSSGSVTNTVPAPVTPDTYDDTSSTLVYSGDWYAWSGAGPYNNSLHFTATPGNSVSLTFTGTQASLLYSGFNNRGIGKVLIDGTQVATINQYSDSTLYQQRWNSATLSPGTHTITFQHDSGGIIDIDAIITTNGNTATPTVTRTFTPTITRTSGGPSLMPSATPYDDSNSLITYAGGWYIRSKGGAYADSIHVTSGAGTASFNFTGTQLGILYTANYNRGVADIFIDGSRVAALNQYDPNQIFQKRWDSPVLSYGTHSVVISYVSGSYVELDAVIVSSSVTPSNTPTQLNPATLTPTPTFTATPTATNTSGQPAFAASGTPYDDTNSLITYNGAWYTREKGGAYNNTIHFTSGSGSANFSFIGTQLSLLYTANYNRGVADIFIDGSRVAALNQYDPNQIFQKRWDGPTLTYGTHSVSINYVSGAYIELDAVIVTSSVAPSNTPTATKTLLTPATSTPTVTPVTPTKTFTPSPTPTQTSVQSALGASTTPYDDSNALITYTGGWYTRVKGGAYNDSIHVTSGTGTASFSFTGTQLGILYTANYNRGIADIFIDGSRAASLNQYDLNQIFQKRWDSSVLAYGTHSVVISYVSGAYIELDALIISSNITPTATKTQLNAASPTPTPTATKASPTPTVTQVPPTPTATENPADTGFLPAEDPYDDSNPLITYSGSWYSRAKGGTYNDTTHVTSGAGTATFKFTGTGFGIIFTANSNRGIANISVDGVRVVSLNQYYPSQEFQVYWESPELPLGTYTVSIEMGSGPYVELDAVTVFYTPLSFIVQPGTPSYIANFTHPDLGDNWMGVAGIVFDQNGNPRTDIVLVVEGTLNGNVIEEMGLTGTDSEYAEGAGYEIKLADQPIASSGTLQISLYSLKGYRVAGPFPFDTYADATKNLVLINFVQQ